MLIDKKAKQKEQLMIPRAVLDMRVNQNTNAPSFAVSNQPFDPFGQSQMINEEARSSMAHIKHKDDVMKKKPPMVQVSQLVAGGTIPAQNQGFI